MISYINCLNPPCVYPPVNTNKMIKRKVLQAAVAGTLVEIGFDSADHLALETLTEILQSYICEIGTFARGLCELAGRTEPLFADVILALIEMGCDVTSIEAFAKRDKKCVIPSPTTTPAPKTPAMLQAGSRQQHPQHIPTHLPPFPDPHAYIRTPTHKQPVTEYEAIREKAASQKRDIERALNKFIAKTGDTDSLFTSNDTVFPLIACTATFPPYMAALCPKDQIFEFEDVEPATAPPRKRKAPPSDKVDKPEENGADDEANDTTEETRIEGDAIDNPYLRPAKVPIKIKIKDLINP